MELMKTEDTGSKSTGARGSYQGHAECTAHDGMEEVMCSRARHNKEFTDEKIFAAGIV